MYKRSYKRKSKASESADEGAKTPKPDNELEVTGVSRSGRVRKKSSKLIDYESGAEEDRPRRKADAGNTQRTPNFKKQNDQKQDSGDNETSNDNQNLSESENEGNFYPTAETYEDSTAESSGSELDDDIMDDKLTIDTGPSNAPTEIPYSRTVSSGAAGASQVNKSLYMIEKFAKKRKNGRGGTKAGRKDKGKARFSAYMLWAREVRPDLMKSNPNIDFSQLSTRLSDLWATVPYTEKYMWKQKAKRMAMKAKESDNKEDMNAQILQLKSTLRKKFINKKSPPSAGKISIQDSKTQSSLIEVNATPTRNTMSSIETKPVASELPVAVTKNVSTQPLDVAAHLKLLGESLSIIGQRLKEHEGQIAVSGSLSVLLDTLLCSLGPLLCLTQQVEEMNGCSKEILSSILDNIAYIMPGL